MTTLRTRERAMTVTDLERLLAVWKCKLRLQDWEIKIGFCRLGDMDEPARAGQVNWQLQKRLAIIDICDPASFPEHSMNKQDIEKTVVHELIHLVLAHWNTKGGSLEETLQEQAVDQIAGALVRR